MSKAVLYQPTTVVSGNDRLLVCLFLAALVHAILLLGISYKAPESRQASKAIEITLVTNKIKKAPETAKFLAPDNQASAGQKTIRAHSPKLKIPMPEPQEFKAPVKMRPSPLKESTQEVIKERSEPKAAMKVVTRKPQTTPQIAESPKVEEHAKSAEAAPEQEAPRHVLSADTLRSQIAQLGKQVLKDEVSEEQSRIKDVKSVGAHRYLAAQYMSDWENKVERTGNLNYPEEARSKNFNGKLTMTVGIKPNGNVYSIRITKSSGLPALDEAAKKIVMMSAPFAPLPKELLRELDVLVITRVWSFEDEIGVSAR